jgi:hypothetical protein
MPRRHRINPNNIPQPFHPLIPYAEKWAISDYTDLSKAIDEASIEEISELVKIVSDFEAVGFDEWLGNPGTNNYTRDWVAFVLLIDACDVAKLRLQSEKEN